MQGNPISGSDTKKFVIRLVNYAKPYTSKIILGFICMVLVAASTAASAKLLKPIINDIFLKQRDDLLLPITSSIFLFFYLKVSLAMVNLY